MTISGVKEREQFIPTTLRVSDFLAWQRMGALDLQPRFQRRSVWKPGAKSYLVDSVVRQLPVPLIFLRERLDLLNGETIREVVDGQQRLRTLIGFIDPQALPDYEPKDDFFTVSRVHNAAIARRSFAELPGRYRAAILSYRFSVQILPEDMSDRDILEVFARLNSTGQRLTKQELRNAAFFGECKTLMYQLALEQTERWLAWRLFTSEQLTRMPEVEMTSDLCYNILHGLSGKSQARLDRMYKDLDEDFPESGVVATRFRAVISALQNTFGSSLTGTVYSAEVHFFTLFVAAYHLMYGLGSPLVVRRPAELPLSFRAAALEVSRRFREWEVPTEVLDAVSRASADHGRRLRRFEYLLMSVEQAESVQPRSRRSEVAPA